MFALRERFGLRTAGRPHLGAALALMAAWADAVLVDHDDALPRIAQAMF